MAIRYCRWLPLGCIVAALAVVSAAAEPPRTFHLDATRGDDTAAGTSPAAAWRTLARANREAFRAGDRLLLARGARFPGTLAVSVAATAAAPFIVGAYGETSSSPAPVIDAAGFLAGVRVGNSRHVVVEDLAITADAGEPREAAARTQRHGVQIVADAAGDFGPVALRRLHVHGIFASAERADEGSRATTNQGLGLAIHASAGRLVGVRVESCRIERTGRTGIDLSGGQRDGEFLVEDVALLDNTLTDIGGPGMNPRRCRRVVVRGNTVTRTGSSLDPRMHARGSGIWPWKCEDVLIERNRFLSARGKADSCGVHIDYGCRDVIVQYNFTADNEGGFIEILGDNERCAYRYNISVNDGFRVKGAAGAIQEGKIIWTSGFTGGRSPRVGPLHSYLYNNTIFVRPGGEARLAFGATARGLLIANNIFYLHAEARRVPGDQEILAETGLTTIPDSLVSHNLFATTTAWPAELRVENHAAIVGDPDFANPGGLAAADYTPRARALVADRGLAIAPLPGDAHGPKGGLAVAHDILGHPIRGAPDLGAIELPEPR
jgi:hypothetical protein